MLLSDGGSAADWPIARDVADYLDEDIPDEDDEDADEPLGDLDMLADAAITEFDLINLVGNLDLNSPQMSMRPRRPAAAQSARTRPSSVGLPGLTGARSLGSGRWISRSIRPGGPSSTATYRSVPCCSTRPARSWPRRATNANCRSDPTAHAEVLVLRAAAAALGDWRLTDHTLVVTLEPCAMCAGALVLARVGTLVFGAYDPKAGAVASLFDVVRDSRLNHRVEVRGGIRADECRRLLSASSPPADRPANRRRTCAG